MLNLDKSEIGSDGDGSDVSITRAVKPAPGGAKPFLIGSVATAIAVLPMGVLLHALFPMVLMSSVVAIGAAASVTLGFLALTKLAWAPEKQTREPGQKSEKDRLASVKAAAETAFNRMIESPVLNENETILFKDPGREGERLTLTITEVREFREDAQSTRMQRIVARVYAPPLAGQEFSKCKEITGVGPVVRVKALPSSIDVILAEAIDAQSHCPHRAAGRFVSGLFPA